MSPDAWIVAGLALCLGGVFAWLAVLGERRAYRRGQREPARRLAALLHHVETCPDCLLRMRNCGAPFVHALHDATLDHP